MKRRHTKTSDFDVLINMMKDAGVAYDFWPLRNERNEQGGHCLVVGESGSLYVQMVFDTSGRLLKFEPSHFYKSGKKWKLLVARTANNKEEVVDLLKENT